MAEDDDERLRSDLDRLKASLSKARESRSSRDRSGARGPPGPRAAIPAMSLGMRAGSEFITAVVLGAGIGWGLDRLARHQPGVSDRVFLPRGRGRGVERDPRDFAQRRGTGARFALVSSRCRR